MSVLISFMKPSLHNVYQSITLYILKDIMVICQLYLHKTEKKKKNIIFQVHKGSYRMNLFIWNSR